MRKRLLTASCLLMTALGCARREEDTPEPLLFVGRSSCAECHAGEQASWRGSHHDLAMQLASENTVLGNFDEAEFRHHGVTSTFSHRDGEFRVRTEGPGGEPAEYTVAYTFGVEPLQQYLVEFPGGRMQTLPLCWDTRPPEEGGQRWFHIYGEERIPPDDVLYWTGPNQNWNHMCAECHSTDVLKRYVAEEDRFDTSWAEIDVSCEACHGPASAHLEWARSNGGRAWSARSEAGVDSAPLYPRDEAPRNFGFPFQLPDRDLATWEMNPGTGTAKRSVPRTSRAQVETCGRCHSRRSTIREAYVHGRPLLDSHRVATLDEGLYFPDGQIEDEVYVYGSFLQSRMYARGVTCTNCHDAHSGRVLAEGNALCARCHLPSKFDTPEHHLHKEGSAGASCVECHMPERTYMVVDARRDHSLRVPRPDLSVKLGTPNACSQCHRDRSAEWAAGAVAAWYGPERRAEPHWGEAIHAGREAQIGAGAKVVALVRDTSAPAIARASAVPMLARYGGEDAMPALTAAIRDPDPLVRAAAAEMLDTLAPMDRVQLGSGLLADSVRVVRTNAARSLATVPPSLLDPEQRARLRAVLDEYVAGQLENADRPEAQLNLGALALERGELASAEASFRRAIEILPGFIPAWVNLADVYRQLGRDASAERVLRDALERYPGHADLHHALGLALVRLKRTDEALEQLERAAELEDTARFSYVYAVALHSTGDTAGAIRVLEGAFERHPGDPEIASFLGQLRGREARPPQ